MLKRKSKNRLNTGPKDPKKPISLDQHVKNTDVDNTDKIVLLLFSTPPCTVELEPCYVLVDTLI